MAIRPDEALAYHASKAVPAMGLWAYLLRLTPRGAPAHHPTERGRR